MIGSEGNRVTWEIEFFYKINSEWTIKILKFSGIYSGAFLRREAGNAQ